MHIFSKYNLGCTSCPAREKARGCVIKRFEWLHPENLKKCNINPGIFTYLQYWKNNFLYATAFCPTSIQRQSFKYLLYNYFVKYGFILIEIDSPFSNVFKLPLERNNLVNDCNLRRRKSFFMQKNSFCLIICLLAVLYTFSTH